MADNVIPVVFDESFYDYGVDLVKKYGRNITERILLDEGYHPTFVSVAIERMVKRLERGLVNGRL